MKTLQIKVAFINGKEIDGDVMDVSQEDPDQVEHLIDCFKQPKNAGKLTISVNGKTVAINPDNVTYIVLTTT